MWFLAFLVLPSLAISHACQIFDYRFILAWIISISVFGYIICYRDKRKAQLGLWRTSEATLHLIEFAGGWIGSFIAQRQFRHKTSKTSYQIIFWIIVLLYQITSIDFLQDWHWIRMLLDTKRQA